MKHVHKTVLLAFSPQQMYDLVTDVAAYPQFLPWCERTEVLVPDDGAGMTARLHLVLAGMHHAFTTRNTHEPGRRVQLALVDGPFKELAGDWHFTPIGPDGAACRVTLDLRYAFASAALDVVLGPVFGRIAASLVDAFVKRADALYASGR